MGFFGRIRNSVSHLASVIGGDIRRGEQYIARHTIQPIGHVLGSAGSMIQRDARWVGTEVKQIGRTIGHDAQVVAGGVQAGFWTAKHTLEGVGQVVGKAEGALGNIFDGVGSLSKLVPVVLAGGGIVLAGSQLGLWDGARFSGAKRQRLS